MKFCLFILIANFLIICNTGSKEISKVDSEKFIKDTVIVNTLSGLVRFTDQVQPILIKNCSPCHFPGGKLYEKLPFDNPKTIIEHEVGIFKRIKEKDEIHLIKKFIKQQGIRTSDNH